MVLGPLVACFLKKFPGVQIELSTDEGYVDIVEWGFDAGIRMGESVQKDMVAIPLGGPVTVAVVGSPAYFERHPAPRHPSDLVRHSCIRLRFSGSGAIYKWEFDVDGRRVEYEVAGGLTISDTLYSVEAAREGAGLAGRLAGLQRGFRETVAELRKVQWPDRLTTRNLTLVVIGMSVTLSALLGLFDGLLTRLFEWLIKV